MTRRVWSRSARRGVVALGLAVVVAGCDGASDGGSIATMAGGAAAGSGEALASHAPARFGFGASADEARVALWDIDVRPDGVGLPAGSGSVAQGREVFTLYCVSCHGATGTEGPNDQLVNTEQWDAYPAGRAVGNYWPYATTLYDYIRKAMPQLTPGILTPDQVYGVIAYILWMNEIVPEDAVMDAQSLPAVVMPARDKFVVDDRMGGSGPIR